MMNIGYLKFSSKRQRTQCGVTTSLIAGVVLFGSSLAVAEEIESSIARGGQLYDKWYKVVEEDPPQKNHPAYPTSKKYADKPKSNWRCKECHGWDYMGKEGAYKSGKHATGIKGITAYKNAEFSEIVTILKNGDHGYTDDMMDAQDFEDLALFVSKGQINMDEHINRATKQIDGDRAKGEPIYNTVCAKCHGNDGKKIKDGEALGEVANSNPWEAFHKIRNGQPDEQMPALRVFDNQIILDILAYMQTLPE